MSEPSGRPAFAHASEAEMARILDFYEVRWEYEPHVFPLLWSLDGNVVESFSPDFYLPDLDLYLELTTLKQRLVRRKNRKLRRIRELYPDVRIKLFYARDFRALMLKYGKLAVLDELSGTSGQVVPPLRAVSIAAVEAVLVADGGSIEPEAVPVALAEEAESEPAEIVSIAAAAPSASRSRSRRRRAARAARARAERAQQLLESGSSDAGQAIAQADVG